MTEEPPGPPTLPPGVRIDQRESGLEIIEVATGDGRTVGLYDKIVVAHTIWLTDGTFVEGSRAAAGGHRIDMADPHLLQGWVEGLQGMAPGGKRRLIVPSDLAYGSRGRPPKVPPYSTLISDVELLGFE
jgi:FKBP-type peptidyl-prolyl cis-trans isomerase